MAPKFAIGDSVRYLDTDYVGKVVSIIESMVIAYEVEINGKTYAFNEKVLRKDE